MNLILKKDLKGLYEVPKRKRQVYNGPWLLNSSQQFCQSINTFWTKYLGKSLWPKKTTRTRQVYNRP